MSATSSAPQAPLPTVRLGPGCEVSRLMIGSNPMSGFSHFSPERDRAMGRYYTAARTLALLRRCEELGLGSVLLRGDRLMCRLYRDHCLEGGKLTLVAQTASELADQAAHVKQLAALAAGIYLHGTWVDNLFHSGREAEVHDLLKRVRDTGKAVGLGTHRPEVVAHAEEHGWDLDFYMACFYNLAKVPKQVVAVAGGPAPKEEFDPADPPRMTAMIRSVHKPCLAFKVLGAGRSCGSPAAVRAAFEYAYASIKPGDAVVVGVFQQDGDQLAENVATVRRLLSAPAATRS
ncbi:MAG TPA: hypothetical protein PK280_11380 [Planctomycetota bacterium]|nr:hypothetical protein [Planctomycetota bacterium]